MRLMALADQGATDGKAWPASISTRQLAGEMVAASSESRLNIGGTPQISRLGVMLVKLVCTRPSQLKKLVSVNFPSPRGVLPLHFANAFMNGKAIDEELQLGLKSVRGILWSVVLLELPARLASWKQMVSLPPDSHEHPAIRPRDAKCRIRCHTFKNSFFIQENGILLGYDLLATILHMLVREDCKLVPSKHAPRRSDKYSLADRDSW